MYAESASRVAELMFVPDVLCTRFILGDMDSGVNFEVLSHI